MIIDYETQSSVDLKRYGSHKYIADPSTRILSMAVQLPNGQKYFYVPEYQTVNLPLNIDGIPILRRLVPMSDECAAHNATGFESLVTKRFFNKEPQWLDTIHLCRQNGLPGALEKVAQILGNGLKLDGLKSVLLMQPKNGKYPCGTLPLWLSILRYNMQDVILTEAIMKRFPKLQEPEVCKVDQIINHRGIYVDTEFTKQLVEVYGQHEEISKRRSTKEFGFDGEDLWSNPKVANWIKENCGLDLSLLKDEERKRMLVDPESFFDSFDSMDTCNVEGIRRASALLELRRSVVRTGSAKLSRLLDMLTQGRLRGSMVYHGAHTGRWAAYGANPYNLPRPPKGIDYPNLCYNLTYEKVKTESERLGIEVAEVLSSLIRPCFRASAGKTLVIIDYSMIEARMIAWLANDQAKIALMNSGKDPYTEFGQRVGGDRQAGKIAVLGAGYGMGKHRCSIQYKIPMEKAALTIKTYRDSFPAIPRYWTDLHRAGLESINAGRTIKVGHCDFIPNADSLRVRLPSGRSLCYRNAAIQPAVAAWRKLYNAPAIEEPTFFYDNPKGYRASMYGGKWAENIDQGCCRDLLRDMLLKCETMGMGTVLHVYDELVIECDKDEAPDILMTLTNLMSDPVPWAPGFKCSATGFISEYYIKE
jgi:DNA polymerase